MSPTHKIATVQKQTYKTKITKPKEVTDLTMGISWLYKEWIDTFQNPCELLIQKQTAERDAKEKQLQILGLEYGD